MRTKVITQPTIEPMTVAEARIHLRNSDISSNDEEVVWFIKTAREVVENKIGRKLLTQTLESSFDYFSPYCNKYGVIELPFPPLQSVTSIKYLDSNGAEQTFPPIDYVVDTSGDIGRIKLAFGSSWPVTLGTLNAVTIRFVSGWTGAAQVPQAIKTYMKMLIESMDSNRGLLQEKEPFLTPFAEHLLDQHRIMGV